MKTVVHISPALLPSKVSKNRHSTLANILETIREKDTEILTKYEHRHISLRRPSRQSSKVKDLLLQCSSPKVLTNRLSKLIPNAVDSRPFYRMREKTNKRQTSSMSWKPKLHTVAMNVNTPSISRLPSSAGNFERREPCTLADSRTRTINLEMTWSRRLEMSEK